MLHMHAQPAPQYRASCGAWLFTGALLRGCGSAIEGTQRSAALLVAGGASAAVACMRPSSSVLGYNDESGQLLTLFQMSLICQWPVDPCITQYPLRLR